MGCVTLGKSSKEAELAVSNPQAAPADKLFVLACCFMPVYSQIRVDLFRKFEIHMREFP
jgi:hypothetical protein